MCRSVPLVVASLACLSTVALGGNVVINEIHFQPADKTIPEEFVELFNAGDDVVDLSGWFFSDGISYTFPAGTRLAPAEYLVVAEDPQILSETAGVTGALGPYEGRFANEGEEVVLRNATGRIEDRVDYKVSFPWPIAPGGRGHSMELLNPSLDNNLGGSWRASGMSGDPPVERFFFLTAEDEEWHYREARSEPSDPVTAWRDPEFVEDGSWLVGQTSIGMGDDDDNTVLEDMRENYTGVYLRHSFLVNSPEDVPDVLGIRLYVDDGAIVWINGVEVIRFNVDPGEHAFDSTASRGREARWQELFLRNPASYMTAGQNLVAVHAMNSSPTSGDFSIDLELFAPGSDESDVFLDFPTPGEQNSVFRENPPPQIRQVRHFPEQPPADHPITITARITDQQGVETVLLDYQVVAPGDYLPAFLPIPHNELLANPSQPRPPNPDFEDPANWSTVLMLDNGTDDDEVAGDFTYTARIPPQGSRTLVRYRISAADTQSAAVAVPYPGDMSLNFACFVYDGVPPYVTTRTSVHPEGAGHIYGTDVLNSLPVYFLITRARDLSECIAYSSAFQIPKSNEGARDKFNWEGAFVYEGVVYDHVKYRLRQANDRYGGSGKRSMRIRFHKGRYFQARDNYGREFPARWRTLNTGKMFDNKRVGNFGLTETLNHNLWNLVGVPSPWMHTFHFRVIDGPEEAPDGQLGQYLGDFWGMFVGIEDYDARFIDAHNMADGNLYKLKDGIFNGNDLRRNQGRHSITTDADFQNIRRNLRPERTDEWLDLHVNYDRWYPYHAVVEAVRHYDFRPADSHSKNRAWFFEPYPESEFGRLWTLPWDSDASWGPNWNDGVDYSKNAIFAGRGKPAYKQKYRNVIREFRDLLWTQEVIHQMIDDLAEFVREFSLADRDRWRGAPAQAGSQDFGPLDAKVVDMKRFAFVGWSGSTGPTVPAGGRARHLDNLSNAEGDGSSIPETPEVTYTGPEGFPIDALTFVTTDFHDPQGDDTFAAMRWRLGEITSADAPGFDPQTPRAYEWNAVWESDELTTFVREATIPPTALKTGHTYRVRAKMLDNTGRWSHWSQPAEFTAGTPLVTSPQEDYLRITEIMYNPVGDSAYEFIELQNTGPETLDLTALAFRNGIRFAFADAEVTRLDPGEYVVLVNNRQVFRTRYGTEGVLIAGEYSGDLSNGGESIELTYGEDMTVLQFAYEDSWYSATDGEGYSLTVVDPRAPPEFWGQRDNWRPSRKLHGSPGGDDVEPAGGLQLPGDLNQDGRVNVTDVVSILRLFFQGAQRTLPCGAGSSQEEPNRILVDIDGDQTLGQTDAIHLLLYLFQRGPPPALGTGCVPIPGCPNACP